MVQASWPTKSYAAEQDIALAGKLEKLKTDLQWSTTRRIDRVDYVIAPPSGPLTFSIVDRDNKDISPLSDIYVILKKNIESVVGKYTNVSIESYRDNERNFVVVVDADYLFPRMLGPFYLGIKANSVYEVPGRALKGDGFVDLREIIPLPRLDEIKRHLTINCNTVIGGDLQVIGGGGIIGMIGHDLAGNDLDIRECIERMLGIPGRVLQNQGILPAEWLSLFHKKGDGARYTLDAILNRATSVLH